MVQIKMKQEIPPLLHPPLLETIFELRWQLASVPESGRYRDVAYPMMYGRMYERLKHKFPLIEDLPSVQVHPETSPFIPRHRLRKERNGFPLLQIGPGILTINDAKGYSWSHYKNLVLEAMEAVIDLYPKDVFTLHFVKAEIRYVNGILMNSKQENPQHFLSEMLHMKVDVDKQMFENSNIQSTPNGVGLNLSYPLTSPAGNLMLSVNLGHMESKPAYILQTLIQSVGEAVPQDEMEMNEWVHQAHKIAEHCFLCLCKGTLMQRFNGN